MPAGKYLIRVYVNDLIIPLYQYYNVESAYVYINEEYTPKIAKLEPDNSLPESIVKITGDFKVNFILY